MDVPRHKLRYETITRIKTTVFAEFDFFFERVTNTHTLSFCIFRAVNKHTILYYTHTCGIQVKYLYKIMTRKNFLHNLIFSMFISDVRYLFPFHGHVSDHAAAP